MNSKVFWALSEAYQLGVCNQEVVEEETLSDEELGSIQEWVEELISEGYDLDQYSDEELYLAYLEDLDESRGGGASPETPPSFHKLSRDIKKEKGIKTSYDDQGKMINKYLTMQKIKRKEPPYNEELDLYDIVSEYLISEGFCDSYEDADVIMANMSEEWRNSILDEIK